MRVTRLVEYWPYVGVCCNDGYWPTKAIGRISMNMYIDIQNCVVQHTPIQSPNAGKYLMKITTDSWDIRVYLHKTLQNQSNVGAVRNVDRYLSWRCSKLTESFQLITEFHPALICLERIESGWVGGNGVVAETKCILLQIVSLCNPCQVLYSHQDLGWTRKREKDGLSFSLTTVHATQCNLLQQPANCQERDILIQGRCALC